MSQLRPNRISGRVPPISGEAHAIPKPVPHWRLGRLRRVAWILDRSIPIGGGYRIGLDPLIGLIPGVGDWIGALFSLYLVYEAARLGLPIHVLGRMGANIAVESFVGLVPVLGDSFDFFWQANIRNLRLVEDHFQTELRPRSLRSVWLALGLFSILLLAVLAAAGVILVRIVFSVF
jgi:hypothetical protein